jgi:tetratricopeptide (TPR) repeat protein
MKGILRLSMLAVSVFTLLSCASDPEPVPTAEPTGEPKVTEEPEVPPPTELRDRAEGLREMIVEYQLAQYAEPSFEAAETAYQRGIDVYGTDNETAEAALAEAVEGFETVYEAGFRELVVRRRNLVEEQIEAGIDARADVAVRDLWTDATESLTEADEAADAGEYPEALVLYDEALEDFAEATAAAEDKREQALRAVEGAENRRRSLDDRVEELEETTRQELEDSEEEE